MLLNPVGSILREVADATSGDQTVNSLIKLFLDKLSERIFSLIGSSIGSAATTYHAVQQAEQQSLLEDLARKYESDGKHDVAARLRDQATRLANGDPAVCGKEILHKIIEDQSQPLALPQTPDTPATNPKTGTSRTRRRRRVNLPTNDDQGE